MQQFGRSGRGPGEFTVGNERPSAPTRTPSLLVDRIRAHPLNHLPTAPKAVALNDRVFSGEIGVNALVGASGAVGIATEGLVLDLATR